jgi:hypothetical protein
MKIIQTTSNLNDFQSRIIEVKGEYSWESFITTILMSNNGIKDEEVLKSSYPLSMGVLLPVCKNKDVLQKDDIHFMMEYCREKYEAYETVMFLLLPETKE